VNVSASTVYAASKPPQLISRAPTIGPIVNPRLNEAMLSALAAGIRSIGSSRAMIALRAGLFAAKQADCTAMQA
jgi:hypothetical protein